MHKNILVKQIWVFWSSGSRLTGNPPNKPSPQWTPKSSSLAQFKLPPHRESPETCISVIYGAEPTTTETSPYRRGRVRPGGEPWCAYQRPAAPRPTPKADFPMAVGQWWNGKVPSRYYPTVIATLAHIGSRVLSYGILGVEGSLGAIAVFWSLFEFGLCVFGAFGDLGGLRGFIRSLWSLRALGRPMP